MKDLRCKGAIFDLDGVITKTADLHFKAWKKTFDEYLKYKSEKNRKKFNQLSHQDYLQYIDGKPRYQGVKSFLDSRGIDIIFGEYTDAPDKISICGIGNKKNMTFRKIISEKGVVIFDTTVDLIKQLKKKGVKIGAASSSKNCRFILEKTGLIDLFGTVVNGLVSKELNLKGKPDPDIFVVAAKNLGFTQANV